MKHIVRGAASQSSKSLSILFVAAETPRFVLLQLCVSRVRPEQCTLAPWAALFASVRLFLETSSEYVERISYSLIMQSLRLAFVKRHLWLRRPRDPEHRTWPTGAKSIKKRASGGSTSSGLLFGVRPLRCARGLKNLRLVPYGGTHGYEEFSLHFFKRLLKSRLFPLEVRCNKISVRHSDVACSSPWKYGVWQSYGRIG